MRLLFVRLVTYLIPTGHMLKGVLRVQHTCPKRSEQCSVENGNAQTRKKHVPNHLLGGVFSTLL